MEKRQTHRWLLFGAMVVGVFILALLFRVWGNTAGLPQPYAHDEWTKVIDSRALPEMGFVHWNRQPSFMYNGLLLVSVLGEPWQAAWEAKQTWPTEARPDLEPHSYYVWLGRGLMAMIGAVTAVLIFLLGRQLWNSLAGVVAAVMFAVSPLPVMIGRYIKEDAPLAMGTALALIAIVALVRRPTYGRYALAGGAVGLATGMKWAALAMTLLIVIAAVIARPAHDTAESDASATSHAPSGLSDALVRFKGLLLAAATSVVGYFTASPNSLLNLRDVISGIRFQGTYMVDGHYDGIEVHALDEAFTFYLREGLWPGVGLAAALATVLGAVWLCRREWRVGALLALWTFGVYLVLELAPAKPYPFFARYLAPVLPSLCVLAGIGVAGLIDWARAALPWRVAWAGPVLASVLIVLVLAEPATRMAMILSEITDEPRDAAAAWVLEHVPPGELVAVTLLSPYIDPEVYEVESMRSLAKRVVEEGSTEPAYWFAESFETIRYENHPGGAPHMDRLLELFETHGEVVAEFYPRFSSYAYSRASVRIIRTPPFEP